MGRIACLACLSLAGLVASESALSWTAPGYPRVAGNFIGSPQNYQDPANQQQLARFNLDLLNIWPGWQSGRGTTFAQVVQNIKAISPNTLVFPYTIMQTLGPAPSSASADVWSVERAALNNNQWWLYSSGTSGQVLDGGFIVTNETLFTPVDSNGYHFVDWFAHFIVQQFYTAAPAIDGFYSDNIFVKPRDAGDWNRDGSTDSTGDPTVATWLRQGEAQYVKDLVSLMPGKLQMANLSDFGGDAAVFPELQGAFNGGFMEGLIGFSWSPETWGGWTEMMKQYRKEMSATTAPQLNMFAQIGSVTDYQSMRYGLTSCLMDNAYYTFNSTSAYNDLPWFDEYNANLGVATSSPATTAWQKGVFRRDFQNGIALVNPKGNGAQTVTLEAPYVKLTGSQAPSINNGQTVTTVTLQDRDGIILLRQVSVKVPNPPSNVTIKP